MLSISQKTSITGMSSNWRQRVTSYNGLVLTPAAAVNLVILSVGRKVTAGSQTDGDRKESEECSR
jgi:hypothetical protein